MFKFIEKMNNNINSWYLNFIIGVCLVIGGVYITYNQLKFVESSVSANGTVIGLVQKGDSLYPKIQFQDKTGEDIMFVSTFGCSPACYEKQEQVNVLYNYNDINDAQLNSFMSLWLGSIILFFVGTVFIIMSFFKIKRLRHQF